MATEEIITFDDLLALLERNPEYRERLRQQILDEEFQRLPREVGSMAEMVQSHTAMLESMARTLGTHSLLLESLAQNLETHRRIADRQGMHLSRLIGNEAEQRFRENAAGYFGRMMRRIRVTDKFVLADLIDDAVDAGTLTEGDQRSLLALDLALRGIHRETREAMRMAVEVSSSIGERDIMRAADRATLLQKLTGEHTLAVVAGYAVSPAYRQLAEDKGVSVSIVAPPDGGEPEEDDEPAAD